MRSEVLALAAANGFAGLGFLAIGAGALGAPVARGAGLHLLSVTGLGMAVMAVFVIAGLRHSGRDLILPRAAHLAFALVALAGAARVLPEFLPGLDLPGGHHLVSALLWSGAFGAWLTGFLPLLLRPLCGKSDATLFADEGVGLGEASVLRDRFPDAGDHAGQAGSAETAARPGIN